MRLMDARARADARDPAADETLAGLGHDEPTRSSREVIQASPRRA